MAQAEPSRPAFGASPSGDRSGVWTLADVEFVEECLGAEFPFTPGPVIGMIVNLCRQDIAPREGKNRLLEAARRILEGKMMVRSEE